MQHLDWFVLIAFLTYTIWDGLRHQGRTKSLEGLLLAGRSMPWWAVGLSVMATQASAITFIGTTGQAYMYDMRFVQMYLGLPIAVVILAVTLVPLYHRLKVYTIYEVLEEKFGLTVRLVSSGLFLLSRGAAMGVTIAAPAYVLALILNLPLAGTILIIGAAATLYTMFGGITGVIRTDIKQMVLMFLGLGICFMIVMVRLPEQLGFQEVLSLAGAGGKLQSIDLTFDLSEKYNLWSGLLAGLFLMLSYFGADQTQVQRYLTAKSLSDAKISLLLSGIVKVPMQFGILLLGAVIYVHYTLVDRPLLFIPDQEKVAEVLEEKERKFEHVHHLREKAALAWLSDQSDQQSYSEFQNLDQEINSMRHEALMALKKKEGQLRNDTNYVFPYFILHDLPIGLAGLLVAAILAAALSSIDSMLNSLAASSVVDWYRRLQSVKKSDGHYLRATRWATAGWGIFATFSAIAFGETESIVELVNRISSFFYGPILGIFLLLWVPRVDGRSALVALILGMSIVMLTGGWYESCVVDEYAFFFPLGDIPDNYRPRIEYLWLNPLGVAAVVGLGTLISRIRSAGS
ncbi:MAG: sodium-coupled permease [Bacteroidota bacterium]